MPTPTTELAAGLAWLAAVAMGGPNVLAFHAKTFERHGTTVVIEEKAPGSLVVTINGKQALTHAIAGYVDHAWVVDLDKDGNPEIAFQEAHHQPMAIPVNFPSRMEGSFSRLVRTQVPVM
jgi:hypothetical protein